MKEGMDGRHTLRELILISLELLLVFPNRRAILIKEDLFAQPHPSA